MRTRCTVVSCHHCCLLPLPFVQTSLDLFNMCSIFCNSERRICEHTHSHPQAHIYIDGYETYALFTQTPFRIHLYVAYCTMNSIIIIIRPHAPSQISCKIRSKAFTLNNQAFGGRCFEYDAIQTFQLKLKREYRVEFPL